MAGRRRQTTTLTRSAAAGLLAERRIWGPGRHRAGSSFFHYFKDPSGTFSEHYSDVD
jgi:hypothetical protein